jgi:DDE superfamily endonuclease
VITWALYPTPKHSRLAMVPSACFMNLQPPKFSASFKDHLLWPRMELFLEGTHDKIVVQNRYKCSYETGLLLVLFCLSRPRCIHPEMEVYFKMQKLHISACIATFVDALYSVALPYLSDPSIFQHRFELYSRLIHEKSGLGGLDIWGFIDSKLRKTCHPTYFQKHVYSRHKCCHGIKFQSVTTPDGLIALLYGPINGNRHDSFMLQESNLLPQLRALFPAGEKRFSLYGDPAYPQSDILFGGFRRPPPGSPEATWNTKMSKVRESGGWLFKEIITKWSFLDFRASMKIFQMPVAKYFTVATFFTNLHCCVHGSKTAAYFNCMNQEDGRLTLQQYLH